MEFSRQSYNLLHSLAAGGPRTEDPDDPVTVQAMQIVLHLPKQDPPLRSELLAVAAQAVAAVCLDPRAATDPAWRQALHGWYSHRIRKVSRRARNKGWRDVQKLPGITAVAENNPDAQARAFLPGPVNMVPPALRKLQIAGTDLPPDPTPPLLSPMGKHELLVGVDASLAMTLGKAAAQVGHAAMLWAARKPADVVGRWVSANMPIRAVELSHEQFQHLANDPDTIVVHDAGFTEVAPGSVTALATDTLNIRD
ncbi:ACR protein [Corynebacterium sp. 3HC-13]|uniref:peptidyl-tRNA hydrolase n=1 Tax=Corynebacterium poyangense TaxID=2684405 RepID=UPI001CCF4435|nr:peptidyl-tRNA hydrolase [Corynebacterium poyangense]MBZ8178218.1 ACR protein [Corynebacterium poyangense]